MQYPHTLKNNIYQSNKWRPPPFFHSDTNPELGHAPVHFVDKTHVLVVTVELIWLLLLNILSSNFIPTPNKSLRYTRFRRSYVNYPVVVLSYTTFLLDVRCSTWPRSFFLQLLSPMIVQLPKLFLLSTPVAQFFR